MKKILEQAVRLAKKKYQVVGRTDELFITLRQLNKILCRAKQE